MWQRGLIFVVFVGCLGCRAGSWGPYSPGVRVPPPPTGSIGTPYYPPTMQAVPNSTPQGFRPAGASNQWTTARDDRELADSTRASPTPATADENPDAATLSKTPRPVISTPLAASSPRVQGMPVNEVRSPAEPPRFIPPGAISELNADLPVGTGVRQAAATQPLTKRSNPVTAAQWQTRIETEQ
jgi:hypothetical protein